MEILKSSNYVEPVLIPGSDYERRISAQGEEYIHFCSDIDYLLGLKSVELLDPSVLAEMQRLNSAPSPKCSDDDLIRFCKSRYIQEPADCEKWYSYLEKCAEFVSEEVQEQLENIKDSETESVDNIENVEQ